MQPLRVSEYGEWLEHIKEVVKKAPQGGSLLLECFDRVSAASSRSAFVSPWLRGCRTLKTEYLHVRGSVDSELGVDLLQSLCLCCCSGVGQPIPFMFMESSCIYGETIGFF
jgi:hypothetical protein